MPDYCPLCCLVITAGDPRRIDFRRALRRRGVEPSFKSDGPLVHQTCVDPRKPTVTALVTRLRRDEMIMEAAEPMGFVKNPPLHSSVQIA